MNAMLKLRGKMFEVGNLEDGSGRGMRLEVEGDDFAIIGITEAECQAAANWLGAEVEITISAPAATERRKLACMADQMWADFQKHHKMVECDPLAMPSHLKTAWEEWQIAWTAGSDAAGEEDEGLVIRNENAGPPDRSEMPDY